MIKTVNSAGRYVMVQGGFPATTYINTSPGYMNVGDVRYNTSIQRLEVYDGNMWVELNTSHASVGLTPEAEMAIDWAINKKREDAILEEKARNNPAIADLLKERQKIEDQIKVIEILTRDNQLGTN